MKVNNIRSPRSGKAIANQFVISEEGRGALGNFNMRDTFQSYHAIIAVKTVWDDETRIELDEKYWDYSVTTGKYRNIFLGEGKAETRAKIKKGEYTLANLNK